MEFGIFSNQQRHSTDVTESWREDIEEVRLCDRLGYQQAWISEHAGLPYLQDGLATSDHMIARMFGITEQIRFGPAVRRLALYQPVQAAVELASMDHLLEGRYMYGYGHGGPISGYDQRGIRFEDTHEMLVEAIDLIIKCTLETEPFDWDGRYYHGKNINTWPKPIQRPYPPTWLASNTPHLIEGAAKRGHNFFLSQYARPSTVKRLGGLFDDACRDAGRGPSRHRCTALHAIFVAESDEAAETQLAPGWREHLEFNKRYFAPVFNDWIPSGGSLDDVTYEYLIEEGLIWVGSPDTVSDRLAEFYSESGGFGCMLLIAGKNWGTWAQREKSFTMFMEEVAPRFKEVHPDGPHAVAAGRTA